MLAELGLPAATRDAIARPSSARASPTSSSARSPGRSTAAAAPALFARALPVFERHYAAESGRRSRSYPGVVEGLARMRARGLPLACVTNKAGRFTPAAARREPASRRYLRLRRRRRHARAQEAGSRCRCCTRCELLGVDRAAAVIGDSANDVRPRAPPAARCCACPTATTRAAGRSSLRRDRGDSRGRALAERASRYVISPCRDEPAYPHESVATRTSVSHATFDIA